MNAVHKQADTQLPKIPQARVSNGEALLKLSSDIKRCVMEYAEGQAGIEVDANIILNIKTGSAQMTKNQSVNITICVNESQQETEKPEPLKCQKPEVVNARTEDSLMKINSNSNAKVVADPRQTPAVASSKGSEQRAEEKSQKQAIGKESNSSSLYHVPKTEIERAQLMSFYQLPQYSKRAPEPLLATGIDLNMNAFQVVEALNAKWKRPVSFCGLYSKYVIGRKVGSKSESFWVPQGDGVIYFENVMMEDMCLAASPFFISGAPNGNLSVSRMTNPRRAAEASRTFTKIKSVFDGLKLSERDLFHQEYKRTIIQTHVELLKTQQKYENLMMEGYKFSVAKDFHLESGEIWANHYTPTY